MRKIVKFCEKANIILAIENLEVNYHLEYYLEKIKSENLKMLFDIGHSNCFTHNTFELFELHRDRIFAAHIHNNHGKHGVDEHNSLDDGNIDFARFFKIPNNIEYCLIEANPKNTKTPQEFEAFVKNNLRILRGFIS
jgi:sugar phosphate isomerase/epimerase